MLSWNLIFISGRLPLPLISLIKIFCQRAVKYLFGLVSSIEQWNDHIYKYLIFHLELSD